MLRFWRVIGAIGCDPFCIIPVVGVSGDRRHAKLVKFIFLVRHGSPCSRLDSIPLLSILLGLVQSWMPMIPFNIAS